MKERGTTVKTAYIAGMTTVFAMVYILMGTRICLPIPLVMVATPLGVAYGAIYIATTVGALCGASTVTTFSEVNADVAAHALRGKV